MNIKGREAVINLINNISNWFKELPGKIWSWLVNTVNRLVQWGYEMNSKARQAVLGLVNNIVNWFRELPGKIADVGKNIVEGLWNGIKNAGNWIKEKVGSFAQGILDGMKQSLGIHSPSRVFRDEVGKYIALGVGEGFEENIGRVYNKMKKAVDFQTQKLSANLSTTATVGKVLTANITVQGDTYMDSIKVGRMTAPTISKVLKTGGAF